jgi:hypothetical protein
MTIASNDLETKVVPEEEWEEARANTVDAADAFDPAEITEIPPADPNHPLVRDLLPTTTLNVSNHFLRIGAGLRNMVLCFK